MKVVLVGGTPYEHSAARGPSWDARKDFADSSYNYAIGLLKACALADPEASRATTIHLEDFAVKRTQRRFDDAQLHALLAQEPDVVGFSCACWNVHLFLAAAAQVRAERPDTVIVLGGPAARNRPARLLEASPSVDVVVCGDGERAFVELCRRGFDDPSGIADIAFRDGDRILLGPTSKTALDLAELPSPYIDGTFVPRAQSLLIEPSRGCRFRCRFCSWSTRSGGVRYAPPARVAAEVAWATRGGYSGASFCDSAINHDTTRFRELSDAVLEGDPAGALRLSVFLRHEELDAEQLAILRARPFQEIILGLESIHATALAGCGKRPIDAAALERTLAELGATGSRVTLSVMSGLPSDTVRGFEQTLDYVEGLQRRMPDVVDAICCFWLAVLPGTRYEADRESLGFATPSWGTPYILRSRDFSEMDLRQMATILVERTRHNPRLFCEQVHVDVVEASDRELEAVLAGDGAGTSETRAVASVAAADASLLAPWSVREARDGWVLTRVEGSGGEITWWFARAAGGVEVAVRVCPRDVARPQACFSRTRRYEIYYVGQPGPDLAGPALDALLTGVTRLVERNEGSAAPPPRAGASTPRGSRSR